MDLIHMLSRHLQDWANEDDRLGSPISKLLRKQSWLSLLGNLILEVRSTHGSEAKEYKKLIHLGYRRPKYLGYDGPPVFGLLPNVLKFVSDIQTSITLSKTLLLVQVANPIAGSFGSYLIKPIWTRPQHSLGLPARTP